jgi:predicted metal-dependent HD superfamily phosphohydrolase
MASWFHDTGFGLGLENHEAHSCTVFTNFCDANPELIVHKDSINELIKATEYNRQPQTIDEKILRDADLHYLGTTDYKTEANALRLEWEAVLGKSYTDMEWLHINIDFLKNHHFYSSFASHKFEATKRKNLEEVQKSLSLL